MAGTTIKQDFHFSNMQASFGQVITASATRIKNPSLHDTVMEFFKAEQEVFMEWVEMHGDTLQIHYNYSTKLPLHYATFFGLEDIVQKLTIHNQDLVEYSKSVHIAAVKGYTGIIKIFIDKVLDAHGQRYGDVMQAKSVEGLMKLLLQWESNNFYYDGGAHEYHGSHVALWQVPSHYSSHNDTTMKFFLNNFNHGKVVGNALTIASSNGYPEIVKLLLDKGADVNGQGGQYLQAASSMGHIENVNILLEKGADVNSQGGEYGNALQAAVIRNHIEIVNILLEKGADVNSQGGQYGNALQAAVNGNHIEIVNILLEKGADVNSQGGQYGNALQAAVIWNHIEIVNILLENGADVNSQGGRYGNALQAAVIWNHIEIVNILLENGADVNSQGGQYGNALQAAAIGNHIEIVNILLENGADANSQGGQYGNALQAAVIWNHIEIVNILLENGADVNSQGVQYGNALQAALIGGHIEIVNILLGKGVDVNFPGGLYGNALQAALFEGNTEIYTLFLKEGAIPLECTTCIDSYAIFNPKHCNKLLDVQLVHNLVHQRCVQLCQVLRKQLSNIITALCGVLGSRRMASTLLRDAIIPHRSMIPRQVPRHGESHVL
jgi:ankyrin repeat protein